MAIPHRPHCEALAEGVPLAQLRFRSAQGVGSSLPCLSSRCAKRRTAMAGAFPAN
ncbi:MAG: hypothetical protein HC936_18740 [Leptolyngbyaceae cyanobacterium SU_3_3]|nr:hypothetical protein [Leptolyngbyaceae cyanobacterium SU_3_3]NJR49260.1 hypothetical protein [Leptolyngbyaceae cyanobacterium CSU_1_3]